MDSLLMTTENAASVGQANITAITKSGQIWAAGLQEISQTMAAAVQSYCDNTAAAWKSLSGVKSLKEVMGLQTSFVRTSFEQTLTDTVKFTDASMRLAKDAMAPISAQMTLAAEKFIRPIA